MICWFSNTIIARFGLILVRTYGGKGSTTRIAAPYETLVPKFTQPHATEFQADHHHMGYPISYSGKGNNHTKFQQQCRSNIYTRSRAKSIRDSVCIGPHSDILTQSFFTFRGLICLTHPQNETNCPPHHHSPSHHLSRPHHLRDLPGQVYYAPSTQGGVGVCHGMSTFSVFSHSVNWVSWLHLAGELVANHAAVVDMFGAGCGSRLFS